VLFTELWKACAGPLVNVPAVGERVFYLPQGHIEQVKENGGEADAKLGGLLLLFCFSENFACSRSCVIWGVRVIAAKLRCFGRF
jgi:hypothetical protein